MLDKVLLFPYYLILRYRHYLYDKGIIKSYSFQTPTISVGNITVGGTGKTPHIELLIDILKNDYKVAVVSRGYKRKSKGYREVKVDDDYSQVGDEPLQIKRKYPEVMVVVDRKRKRAIETLEALPQEDRPTMILLDDAFQHRAVKPAVSILLISSLRPIHKDFLLPIGKLRDLQSRANAADIVILTKLDSPTESELDQWRATLKLFPNQTLLFSTMEHQDIKPVFPEDGDMRYIYAKNAIHFSGIANSNPLKRYISAKYRLDYSFDYPDHYDYSWSDMKKMERYAKSKSPLSVLLTTEKDAQRLRYLDYIPSILRKRMFYIPIEVNLIPKSDFSKNLLPSELIEQGKKELYDSILEKLK